MATDLRDRSLPLSEISKRLDSTRRRRSPDAGLETSVETPRIPHHQIFAASIELGYHPQRWRSAKIVVLRKPGKPDYSLPGAYRPISLLNTLGKLLEAVIARRLSYLAEHYGLLPDTQFGGRPGRTTEQALLVLPMQSTEHGIDKKW